LSLNRTFNRTPFVSFGYTAIVINDRIFKWHDTPPSLVLSEFGFSDADRVENIRGVTIEVFEICKRVTWQYFRSAW
jgi:hypothetical protein